MADNLGLMLAASGAALIGFVLLTSGKDEAIGGEKGESLSEDDFTDVLCPSDMAPDGTVLSITGKRVIPCCPSVSSFKISDCDYINYGDDCKPICGKFGSPVRSPLATPTDPPEEKWYGPLSDFLNGSPQQQEIPDRAKTAADSKLYMFSGEPVMESIAITKPAWLAEQDPDPIQ
tara:strand:- start:370 stop:894 length:525 start_codon:yes stop_codon:yes gene_type:complete